MDGSITRRGALIGGTVLSATVAGADESAPAPTHRQQVANTVPVTLRVSRSVGAFDAGHVLNAKTARSQLICGIVYGTGMALLEETLVDGETGRIVNTNVAEYLMPVNADVPDIQTIIVANDDKNSNPLNAKGIGELPMVGVAAAIANAVYHATGVRVRKVPMRVEDILI